MLPLQHAWARPSSHLERLLADLSAMCLGMSRCLGISSSNLDLYQSQETEASQSLFCLTLPQRLKDFGSLDMELALPACLWEGPCALPWAQ